MAKLSTSNAKIINIALIVIGIGLAAWGYKLSSGFGSQFSQAFSGSPSDQVMMFYIAGAVCAAIGLFRITR